MDIKQELDDLFDDSLLDLSDKELTLFNLPSDMKLVIKRKKAEYVAQRKPCPDFDKYAKMFEAVHRDLRLGKRSITKVDKTVNLKEGRFFLVDGSLIYLEQIGELGLDKGTRLPDGRTRCIYENGFESDILLQTLRKSVIGGGYGITETTEEMTAGLKKNMYGNGKFTGYLYVLKSKSTHPQIAGVKDLYKIGFTTNTVEERIKNAEKDPTYLNAPVEIVASYRINDLDSHKIESLVHQILDPAQLQVKITGEDGKVYTPKEWYIVPVSVVDTIVTKIIDGSITKYVYNRDVQCLEKIVKKAELTYNTSGYKVLTLRIKKLYLDEILSGDKMIEYRDLKQTTLNKYTYMDDVDGKRYLRWYDMLHFIVGYNTNAEQALVTVKDITYNGDSGQVEYHLGQVLEHVVAE